MPDFLDIMLLDLWQEIGLSPQWISRLNSFMPLLVFVAVILITARISSFLFVYFLGKVAKNTKTIWDDCLKESHFFVSLSRLVPTIATYFLIPQFVRAGGRVEGFLRRIVLAALSLVLAYICATFLDGVNLIYQRSASETAKRRPLKGYIQLAKVFLYLISSILAVTSLLNMSPLGILSGVGAMSAVLLLVFKDAILGIVSGFLLATNDMVRIGDWIEMSAYGADGFVSDITLQSVKVQNWDNTISTIPVYALVSDSFKNWRGMLESGGRRIKRAIRIDMESVHFLSEEEIRKLSRIALIEDYMKAKLEEIAAYNREHHIREDDYASGRRLTNLGTYRAYAEAYIKSMPATAREMACMVRYLPPDEHGLQMELYLFSADKVWVNYERFQADIIDHLLASMEQFSLRVYQSVSGGDIQLLARKN